LAGERENEILSDEFFLLMSDHPSLIMGNDRRMGKKIVKRGF